MTLLPHGPRGCADDQSLGAVAGEHRKPVSAASPLPAQLSLRSVPDGRRLIPVVWWVPLVGLLMVGTTAAAVLPDHAGLGLFVAIAVNLIGYALVWLVIRPGRLRLSPRFRSPTGTESTDVLAPLTQPIPVVSTVDRGCGADRCCCGRRRSRWAPVRSGRSCSPSSFGRGCPSSG